MGNVEEHMQQLEKVLIRLERKNLQVNPLKYFWAKDKVDYLGFVITRDCIMPQPKKIQGIPNNTQPINVNELRMLVGIIIFDKEMYPQWAHVMRVLTERTSNIRKFKWMSKMDVTLTTIKYLVSKDTLLVYPMYRKEFMVHTNSSDYQLGGVVSHKCCLISFFSRNINTTQKTYTSTEKDLLGIT